MTDSLSAVISILGTPITGFIGSWIGARVALSKMRRERAFDRQLDWYERFVNSVHGLTQAIEVSLTFQHDRSADSDVRDDAWGDVQSAHLKLDQLAMEAALYGSPSTVKAAQALQAAAQDVANASEGFDPGSLTGKRREDALAAIAGLPDRLHLYAKPLIEAARLHLGLG